LTFSADSEDAKAPRLLLHCLAVVAILPPFLVSYPVAWEGDAMCRCLGKVCAAVLMLTGAGCLDSFLARQIMVYGPKVVVPGTVDEVAAKLKDGLNETDILLYSKRVGTGYRIVCRKSDFVFCLHLSPKKGAINNTTLVRMQWDRGDEELWQRILKILNAPDEEANAAE
jgi:hypothetical protein